MSNFDNDDEVTAAKARFMDAVNSLHPFNVVNRHPIFSLVSSFFLGFGAERISRKASTVALIPVSLQMAQLVLRSLLKH